MGNIPEEVLLALAVKNSGGGSGGTSNYEDLENKPKINNVTLSGNKSASDLGLATADAVQGILDGQSIDSFSDVETALATKVDKVQGKGLSTNDYDDTEKQKNADNATAITAIKDGSTIDSFADVETALSAKQDALTAGDYIEISNNEVSVNRYAIPAGDVVYRAVTVNASTAYVDKYTSSGTFIERINITVNTYGTQDVESKIRFYREFDGWVITLLANSKEHNAGYSYSARTSGSGVESQNDFTFTIPQVEDDNDLIIRSELDGKQDKLTFDDTPTDGSNNPVKSNGIYDALALKQNATDNSLDTDAKTIVGAINEHEGDISSLKSGLTNLDNEVNGDATTYPYADVITIEDAVPANLADCSVKIEPVQDLHGYDKPWVGGAGKNKLPLVLADIKTANTDGTWSGNTYTLNNVTFDLQTYDGENITGIKVNGTANALTIFYATGYGKFLTVETNYTLNGCTSGAGDTYKLDLTTSTGAITTSTTGDGDTTPFTVANSVDYRARIVVYSGANVSNQMFYPMIRLSTETDATFAPYTNICPISGHTEASVQRDGKNLVNWKLNTYNDNPLVKTLWQGNYTLSTRTTSTNNNWYIKGIKPDGTYCSKSELGLSWFSNASESGLYYGGYNDDALTFSVPSDGIRVRIGRLNADGTIPAQLEMGTVATDFEDYAGKTYTIALGDTIYGGTMDFDSGVMTVTHQYVTKNTSTMNNLEQYPGWTGAGIKQIVGAGIDGVISTCVNVSDVIRANTLTVNDILFFEKNDIGLTQTELIALAIDVEFVVELATPTTIQLTPQQIQLLKGQNTLYASTGDISVTVNGVSGSIGAVQEQVNDIVEDVAELVTEVPNKAHKANKQVSSSVVNVGSTFTFDCDDDAVAVIISAYRYGHIGTVMVPSDAYSSLADYNEQYLLADGASYYIKLGLNYNSVAKTMDVKVLESTVSGGTDVAVVIAAVQIF